MFFHGHKISSLTFKNVPLQRPKQVINHAHLGEIAAPNNRAGIRHDTCFHLLRLQSFFKCACKPLFGIAMSLAQIQPVFTT